jgi:hypothetical protein
MLCDEDLRAELIGFLRKHAQVKGPALTLRDSSWESLRQGIPTALRAIGLEEIRVYERHYLGYIQAYRDGLGAHGAAQKIYRSHRRIGATKT